MHCTVLYMNIIACVREYTLLALHALWQTCGVAKAVGDQVSHRLLPRHAAVDLDHAVVSRIVTVALVGEDLTRFTHHLHRRTRDVD